jgi:Fe-S cluster assembly iron-binding protein IscA
MEKLESNGLTAYIDPNLYQQLREIGAINIDYVTNQMGQSGYRIVIGNPEDCSSKGCAGCG